MRKLARDLFLSILALLPFYCVYFAQLTHLEDATGFIQYDMPYYSANGRAIFERGNNLAHPNPYDPDTTAPPIYFHWITWIFGFGIVVLGADPGAFFLATGLLAGIIGSWLTLKIVRQFVSADGPVAFLFLMSMWGGGGFCLAKILYNLSQNQPIFENLLYLDPGDGLWFLSWGRNFLFPTEATYHALVAAIWLGVLKRREWLAVTFTLMLAATHPFTGVQHILILGAWNLYQLISSTLKNATTNQSTEVTDDSSNDPAQSGLDWQALSRGLVLIAGLSVFFSYYFVFLEQFPAHRKLRLTWTAPFTLHSVSALIAYAPIGILALWQLRRESRFSSPQIGFFLIAFAISLLLVKHEIFIKPHQPIHFTRGYVWMPLFLLALPILENLVARIRSSLSRVKGGLLLALLAVVFCFDNICFLTIMTRKNRHEFHVDPDVRRMFQWVDSRDFDGVVLIPDAQLSYLAATYTSLRPYYGHMFNTPDYETRKQHVAEWLETGEMPEWQNEIDYLMLPPSLTEQLDLPDDWIMIHRNEGSVLFRKETLESP